MVEKAVLLALIGFALANTHYPAPPEPPTIIIAPEIPATMDGRYVPARRIIQLPASWRADEEGQLALLHEIVHWLQDRAGALDAQPRCRMEQEAYRVEDLWRAEHGIGAKPSMERLLQTDCRLVDWLSRRRTPTKAR